MNPSILMLLLLVAAVATVIYLIAADKKRFLIRFDLAQWNEKFYLSHLPNFLQVLHNHHFKKPWPRRRHAVAALHFRLRAWSTGNRRFMRREIIRQHITLFALLETLRPFINDFILNERQKIISERILGMEDTVDRDRLLAFMEAARSTRTQFFDNLRPLDHRILGEMIERRFMPMLKIVHAVFQEHGFTLLPEFSQLRQWSDMTGTELAQDLPRLPALRLLRRKAGNEKVTR